MSFLFPKPAAAALPPIPPIQPEPAIMATSTKVEDDLRTDMKRRKGRASTIVTSSQGLTTEPETKSTSLLGSSYQG